MPGYCYLLCNISLTVKELPDGKALLSVISIIWDIKIYFIVSKVRTNTCQLVTP